MGAMKTCRCGNEFEVRFGRKDTCSWQCFRASRHLPTNIPGAERYLPTWNIEEVPDSPHLKMFHNQRGNWDCPVSLKMETGNERADGNPEVIDWTFYISENYFEMGYVSGYHGFPKGYFDWLV